MCRFRWKYCLVSICLLSAHTLCAQVTNITRESNVSLTSHGNLRLFEMKNNSSMGVFQADTINFGSDDVVVAVSHGEMVRDQLLLLVANQQFSLQDTELRAICRNQNYRFKVLIASPNIHIHNSDITLTSGTHVGFCSTMPPQSVIDMSAVSATAPIFSEGFWGEQISLNTDKPGAGVTVNNNPAFPNVTISDMRIGENNENIPNTGVARGVCLVRDDLTLPLSGEEVSLGNVCLLYTSPSPTRPY